MTIGDVKVAAVLPHPEGVTTIQRIAESPGAVGRPDIDRKVRGVETGDGIRGHGQPFVAGGGIEVRDGPVRVRTGRGERPEVDVEVVARLERAGAKRRRTEAIYS